MNLFHSFFLYGRGVLWPATEVERGMPAELDEATELHSHQKQKNGVSSLKLLIKIVAKVLHFSIKKGNRNRFPYKKWAATYFSTNKCSIISEGGLNFSVRNG
ncbi:MAG: hypothetical protein J5848_07570, partial [Bacteroidales bacterium]|nr:hypothetical protein [Bacteroidales bacterium]